MLCDHAVFEENLDGGAGVRQRAVGGEHNGSTPFLIQFRQQLNNDLPVVRVQISGGFIG